MSEPTLSTAMRCHYEVLDVEMTCNIEEIKKQYKKLALKWHPDRNHGQEEVATKNFKEISGAYNVLSDAQERKWYDDHREAILKGGDGTNGDDSDDESGQSINLWRYFNSTCYDGFDDKKGGFYDVYRTVFEEIHEQESEHVANSTSKAGASDPKPPSFGTSVSTAIELLNFYAYWENFVSKLSFSWEDKYNLLEAPNRQTRRAMEKENLKFREGVKKEFVLQVRSLTAHVKRSDARYAILEEQAKKKKLEEEERKTALRTEEAERRKDAREARLLTEQYTPEELAKREEERKHCYLLADDDSEDEDNEDDTNLAELDAASFYTESELYQKLQELKFEKGDIVSNATRKKRAKKTKKTKGVNPKAVYEEQTGDDDDADEESQPVVEDEEVEIELEQTYQEEEVDEEPFHCEICCKHFKSETHLAQHVASKVHRKVAQEVQKKAQDAEKKAAKAAGKAAKEKIPATVSDI